MQFPTEAIRQRVVMYCAHIRRVTKKGEAPQYVINGKSNLSYNDNCELHECLGNTTVRRRVLSKSKRQNSKTQKARMSRTPLELTPTSESVKYTPREHGEMQQVMRRPFEKHSQRSIVWLTIWVQSRIPQMRLALPRWGNGTKWGRRTVQCQLGKTHVWLYALAVCWNCM